MEVIQKFYQEQSVEQAFSPTNRDKNTYISDLRAAERGEAGNDYNIRLGALPLIYQKIGIENKPVKTKKTIILKDTISKHDVPMNVVENLPELYSNPLMIFKSLNTSTNPDSYVAVLDAIDKNGRQMIAALSPSKKENGYHLITSFYGRNNIDNMIKRAFEEKKVRYIRDKKNGLLTGHNAYLSQADDNILYKSDIVNSLMQQEPQPKGLYDTKTGVIKIFESADFSTLPHELAHYWLDNMWSYVRSGNASEKYRQRWNVIANWLNVKQEQAFLTRGQQEKFARGYEQYLLNGNLPTPIIKGAFDDYDRWLKRVYGDMNLLNVRLSEDAVRFFQSMTTGVLPPQDTSDIIQQAADGLGQLPDVIVIADGGTLADRAFLIFFQKRNVHRRKQAVQIFPAGRRGGSVFGKTVSQLVKFDRKPVFVRKFANNVALARRIEKAFERIGIALPICAADFKQICRPVARNRTAPLFDRGQMQHKFYFYAGFGGRIEN